MLVYTMRGRVDCRVQRLHAVVIYTFDKVLNIGVGRNVEGVGTTSS